MGKSRLAILFGLTCAITGWAGTSLNDRLLSNNITTRHAALQELSDADSGVHLAVLSALSTALQTGSWRNSTTALAVISQDRFVQPELIPKMLELLRSPDPWARAGGRFVLSSIGPPVCAALEREMGNPDATYRAEIIYTISDLQDYTPLLPVLQSSLMDSDQNVFNAAATALYRTPEGLRTIDEWGAKYQRKVTLVAPENYQRIQPEKIPGIYTGVEPGPKPTPLTPEMLAQRAEYAKGVNRNLSKNGSVLDEYERDMQDMGKSAKKIHMLLYTAVAVLGIWLLYRIFRMFR